MASWPTGIQALPSTRYPNHIYCTEVVLRAVLLCGMLQSHFLGHVHVLSVSAVCE